MAGERGVRGRKQGLQEDHKEKQFFQAVSHDPSHPGGVWESTGPFCLLIGPLFICSRTHLSLSFTVFDYSLFEGQAVTRSLFGALSLGGHVGGAPVLVPHKADAR